MNNEELFMLFGWLFILLTGIYDMFTIDKEVRKYFEKGEK